MNPRSSSNRNASLEKAYRLLLAFTRESPELGVMDLARRVGLNKSTVSRFVASMTQVGLLERVEGKKIRLGLRVFEIGMLAMEQHPLVRRGAPLLDRLTTQLRETVTLYAPVEGDVLVLERRDGSTRLPTPLPGRRYPMVAGAAGLAFLASDEALLRAIGPAELGAARRAEIARVRTQGYASVDGDPESDLQSIAAPVRDRTGAVVAAIAVTAPRSRPAATPTSTAALCRAAADFSRRLGFHRGETPLRSLGDEPLRRPARIA